MGKVDPVLTIRCPGRKPVRMHPGETLKIGRQSDNDLVLNDGTVSRHHATIVWDKDDDRPSILDHDSANGVEIDGEFVEGKGWITGGNHVVIGSFTLALELAGTREVRAAAPNANATMSDFLVADDSDSVVLYTEKKKDQAGRFSSVEELRALCLDIEGAGRTGTLTLRVAAVQAKLTFCMGKVMAATYDQLEGKEALRQALLTRSCLYQFKRDIQPTEQQLDISVKAFVTAELGEGDGTKKIARPDAVPAPRID